MPAESVKRLMEHFRDEREVLLNGRISDLESLLARRQEMIEMLDTLQIDDPTALSEARLLARRNQKLLEASLSGIQAARERLEEVRCSATQLDTYTLRGKRLNLVAGNGGVERRA